MIKKIYLITRRDKHTSYCQYIGFVICAFDERQVFEIAKEEEELFNKDFVKIKLLGNAEDNLEIGIILSDYTGG